MAAHPQVFTHRRLPLSAGLFASACFILSTGHAAAQSQCTPQWSGRFASTDLDRSASTLAVFDEAPGPALFVGGAFRPVSGVRINGLARWDGTGWSEVAGPGGALGPPLGFASVTASIVADDGRGRALFVAGSFSEAGGRPANRIARWDGSDWSALAGGINGGVSDITAWNDGTGPGLVVGGDFGVMHWANGQWSNIGTGIDGDIFAVAAFDDGAGTTLFAGGSWWAPNMDGYPIMVGWDGAEWRTVGGGVGPPELAMFENVSALTPFDDGTGLALYASGRFWEAGGTPAESIARWDGVRWSALSGGGLTTGASALFEYNDGLGRALYAVGPFESAGVTLAKGIARWDGAAWSAVGTGFEDNRSTYPAWGSGLAAFDPDGTGPSPTALFAGGNFSSAGGVEANRIASWDGLAWAALSENSRDHGPNDHAFALATWDDGTGSAVFMGGEFTLVDGLPAAGIVKWDGRSFHTLGSGVNGFVRALESFHDGRGPALFVGGGFDSAGGLPAANIARWDGRVWTEVGGGISGFYVQDLAVYDDGRGPALYAGGSFTAAGGTAASGVARWDGQTWSALGTGLGGRRTSVNALAVMREPTGEALFVGGNFETAGGLAAPCLARWDGSAWSAVGAAFTGFSSPHVGSLAVYDDGTGPALFMGSDNLRFPGGASVPHLARWDGSAWSDPGAALDVRPDCMAGFDDGTGLALYISGGFTTVAGMPVNAVARWDGRTWTGVDGRVRFGYEYSTRAHAFAEFEGGLYTAGNFTMAGDHSVPYLTIWQGCRDCYPDCDTTTGIGTLDIFDFLCFQNRYDVGAPYACDCDTSSGPLVCDIFDFLCFQNRFAAGCP